MTFEQLVAEYSGTLGWAFATGYVLGLLAKFVRQVMDNF